MPHPGKLPPSAAPPGFSQPRPPTPPETSHLKLGWSRTVFSGQQQLCAWDTHMHWVRRPCPACAQVWEGAGRLARAEPAPPLPPRSCAHGSLVPEGVPSAGGGPRAWVAAGKEGPQHCPVGLAALQLIPEQLLSCFRRLWSPQSPVITLFLTSVAPEQTVHLGPGHPTACPCAHGDGHPRPPQPAPGPDLRLS